MNTLVFIDVETTGLAPENCSIVQLSGIIKRGSEEQSFDFKLRPYRSEVMSREAQEKTGLTDSDVQKFPDQKEAFNSFMNLLDYYRIGKTYEEKAFFVGYNSDFDMKFLRSWFDFNGSSGSPSFGYRFWWPDIDVARLAALYLIPKRVHMRGFKLTDVYSFIFGEDFEDAHNAMADIKATKRLFEFLATKMLLEPWKESYEKEKKSSIPTRELPVRKADNNL